MKIVGGRGIGADNEKMRIVEIEDGDVVGKQFQVHSEGNDLWVTYYEDGPSGRMVVMLDDPVGDTPLPAPFWVKPQAAEKAQGHRYYGERRDKYNQGCLVVKDGHQLTPRRSLALRNHSPTGFEWGYGGSGPAQLALALLLEEVDEWTALQLYQEFKRDLIALLPRDEWALTSQDIQEWVAAQKKEAKP